MKLQSFGLLDLTKCLGMDGSLHGLKYLRMPA